MSENIKFTKNTRDVLNAYINANISADIIDRI